MAKFIELLGNYYHIDTISEISRVYQTDDAAKEVVWEFSIILNRSRDPEKAPPIFFIAHREKERVESWRNKLIAALPKVKSQTKQEYDIIGSENAQELIDRVNSLMKDGWTPVGAATSVSKVRGDGKLKPLYMQTMMRESDDDYSRRKNSQGEEG